MKSVTAKIKGHDKSSIHLTVTAPHHNHGLVFVMHGDGGEMSAPHNKAIADAYLNKGYVVAALDETNTKQTAYTGNLEHDYALQEETALRFKSNLLISVLFLTNALRFTDRVALAGHSMGGYAALALGAELGPMAHHVTAVSPAHLGKIIETPNHHVKTHLFVGSADDRAVILPVKSLHQRLGPQMSTLDVVEGADHQFNGAQDKLYAAVHDMLDHTRGQAPGHINSLQIRL